MSYADLADIYRNRGWRGVLPLKPGTKSPPPAGYTGKSAPDPTDDQIEQWKGCVGDVAVRMPDGVIGIDVDA